LKSDQGAFFSEKECGETKVAIRKVRAAVWEHGTTKTRSTVNTYTAIDLRPYN